MSLEFEFDQIEDARQFGKNVSHSLKATSMCRKLPDGGY